VNIYVNFAIIAKFNPQKIWLIVCILGGIGIGINIQSSQPNLELAIQVHQLFDHSYCHVLYCGCPLVPPALEMFWLAHVEHAL